MQCLALLRPLAGTEDTIPQRVGEDPIAANGLRLVQDRLNLLAHACATGAGDLETAIAWWPLLGPPAEAPTGNAINHALVLLQNGRADAAWATMSDSAAVERSEGQHLAAALQIAVGAAIDAKRWDDVFALGSRAEAPATTRLSAGTALGSVGRKSQALGILKATCDELTGEPKRICTNNVKVFSQ